MITTKNIPDDIKALFEPFETIDRNDQSYIAYPRFVIYPNNHLNDWSFTQEVTAANGSKWCIRKYSPTRRYPEKTGSYDVICCEVT